jgi:diadenosine tetraphosphate (Ap4A) HIT family hydrolase
LKGRPIDGPRWWTDDAVVVVSRSDGRSHRSGRSDQGGRDHAGHNENPHAGRLPSLASAIEYRRLVIRDEWKTEAMFDCMACELTNGTRVLPGGLIHRTRFWLVEHCIGPLGLGTLVVKPERHVTSVADLSTDEAVELGPLLRRASIVANQLVEADQVYNCLWSHAGGKPVHIHYVVQPITKRQMADFGVFGPNLQVAMFSTNEPPAAADVERIATLARRRFAD